MKLEAGKFYRTRDGRKVVVYAVYLNNPEFEVVHGAVQSALVKGLWSSMDWSLEGRMYSNGEDIWDIIGPWEDEA